MAGEVLHSVLSAWLYFGRMVKGGGGRYLDACYL